MTHVQIRQKAESYCAYQERSQQEVRHKLYEWGLHREEVEQTITSLIEHNFLNESRFALAYTSGKFRLKHWGKFKIKQGLKQKQVSTRLIQEALQSIDNDLYQDTLNHLLEKKAQYLADKDPYKRRQALLNYALQKGFERDLILEILKNKQL